MQTVSATEQQKTPRNAVRAAGNGVSVSNGKR